MKIVLFAMNGSYSHTNLAVRCLRAPLERDGHTVVIVERNLRDRRDEVLQALYDERADLYGFSTYIWNLNEMLSFARDLRSLLPGSVTVFGGPEVSFETERFDTEAAIDHIITGEGEDALPALCRALENGEKPDRILSGGMPDVMRNEGILYRDGDYAGGEMLYYESSRGCPYHCAYCLSSVCEGIRAKNIGQTLDDLRAFSRLAAPVKIVKFVDRTFNFNAGRANAIWEALLSDEYTGHYHFEICASLLNEKSFEILKKFPKGKIQLEIGLQSTNPETLREVSRHIDPQKVLDAARRLREPSNIHVHLDLIAGLPFETYERFKRSFDDAYGAADCLQLGFLKLLPGTALRRDAQKYGYAFMSDPPYTVLKSNWITRDELFRLEGIADLLDRYDASGAFAKSLAYIVPKAASPFAFFDGLLDHIRTHDGRTIRKIAQNDAFRLLYGYGMTLTDDGAEFESRLHEDYAAREARRMPDSVLGKK